MAMLELDGSGVLAANHDEINIGWRLFECVCFLLSHFPTAAYVNFIQDHRQKQKMKTNVTLQGKNV